MNIKFLCIVFMSFAACEAMSHAECVALCKTKDKSYKQDPMNMRVNEPDSKWWVREPHSKWRGRAGAGIEENYIGG